MTHQARASSRNKEPVSVVRGLGLIRLGEVLVAGFQQVKANSAPTSPLNWAYASPSQKQNARYLMGAGPHYNHQEPMSAVPLSPVHNVSGNHP